MDKHAAESMFRVLSELVDTCQKQAACILEKDAALAVYQRREEAAKLASEAQLRGMNQGMDLNQLTQYYTELAETAPEKIGQLRSAMQFIGPDMGARLQVGDRVNEQNAAGDKNGVWDDFVYNG